LRPTAMSWLEAGYPRPSVQWCSILRRGCALPCRRSTSGSIAPSQSILGCYEAASSLDESVGCRRRLDETHPTAVRRADGSCRRGCSPLFQSRFSLAGHPADPCGYGRHSIEDDLRIRRMHDITSSHSGLWLPVQGPRALQQPRRRDVGIPSSPTQKPSDTGEHLTVCSSTPAPSLSAEAIST